jgi:hypothetical protein
MTSTRRPAGRGSGGDGHHVAIDPTNDKIYYQASQNDG